MRIGCLFGTFDPPHAAHVAVAEHMVRTQGLHEVWLVVTPQNPFKMDQPLSPDEDRMAMVELAIEGHTGLVTSGFELALPKPNFTSDTLLRMRLRWPEHEFDLIIGADNLASFQRWKDPDEILAHHRLLVYPREGFPIASGVGPYVDHPRVRVVADAPLLPGSASDLRSDIRAGRAVTGRVSPAVLKYTEERSLYN